MSTHEPTAPIVAEMHRLAPKIDAAAQTPKPKLKAPKTGKPSKLRRADAAPVDSPFTAIRTSMTAEQGRAMMACSPARTRKTFVPYSDEICSRILSLMGEGMMLVEITNLDGMPAMSTIFEWRWKNPDFDRKLTRAREALGDQFAQEVRRVAENSSTETAACDRVKMDAYRWLASKMYPKQYGDRSVQELTGTVTVEQRHVIDATQLSGAQLDALEQALQAASAMPVIEHKQGED